MSVSLALSEDLKCCGMDDDPWWVAYQIVSRAVFRLYEEYGGDPDLHRLYSRDLRMETGGRFLFPSFPEPWEEEKRSHWAREREMLKGYPSYGVSVALSLEAPLDFSPLSVFHSLPLKTIQQGVDLFWDQRHELGLGEVREHLKNMMKPIKLWDASERSFPPLSSKSPLASFFLTEVTDRCLGVTLTVEGENEEEKAMVANEYNAKNPLVRAQV